MGFRFVKKSMTLNHLERSIETHMQSAVNRYAYAYEIGVQRSACVSSSYLLVSCFLQYLGLCEKFRQVETKNYINYSPSNQNNILSYRRFDFKSERR